MPPAYQTALYRRLRAELDTTPIIDSHEHLQRERELPSGQDVHIGRFFIHYANCDLVSAGMPARDMLRLQNDPSLTPRERFTLIEPWYRKSWNTGYNEALRIALRDLYGEEDLTAANVERLTEKMRAEIKPGFTRKVFDRACINYALTDSFGPKLIFNPDYEPDNIIPVMHDHYTDLNVLALAEESGVDILCLDDYLEMIDWAFERYGKAAAAFKVTRAYDRILTFEDVPRSAVEKTFNRLLAFNDRPDRKDIQALEDFILHYLCRKCGETGLRMQFHAGLQEGVGNIITNSRAALMAPLFMKYAKTNFDIFHISYPYQEELATLAKNFPNVTVDFCWMWIINPAAGRRALSDMLDTVPANKIHGFGGDYIFVEGAYAHAEMARREIARVLCEKVEEGRFSEEYAQQVGNMLLRDNVLSNFDLDQRRGAFRVIAGENHKRKN